MRADPIYVRKRRRIIFSCLFFAIFLLRAGKGISAFRFIHIFAPFVKSIFCCRFFSKSLLARYVHTTPNNAEYLFLKLNVRIS